MAIEAVTASDVICGNRVFDACQRLGVMYAKTDYVDQVMVNGPVLVTHNGGFNLRDGPDESIAVTSPGIAIFIALPPNVVTWFALNAISRDRRLRGIPLGVDNFEIPEWAVGDRNFPLSPEVPVGGLVIDRLGQSLPKTNRVYVRLRVDTAPYERGYCVAALDKKTWVTSQKDRRSPDDFFDDMMRHEFVACPEGNGVDCHRIWEALYLGCYPIVKWSPALEGFRSLPILFVQNWDAFGEPDLDRHLAMVDDGVFTMQKATLSYWRDEICKAARQ